MAIVHTIYTEVQFIFPHTIIHTSVRSTDGSVFEFPAKLPQIYF